MIRGEVWWVDFDPSIGGEIQKIRPAVIVSNNVSNKFLNRVQVVPITSNLSRLYPSEALVTVNGERRKAMADQVTTVSKQRLKDRSASSLGRMWPQWGGRFPFSLDWRTLPEELSESRHNRKCFNRLAGVREARDRA